MWGGQDGEMMNATGGNSSFYRTTRGAQGASIGMQGCLNQGGNYYAYKARNRDITGKNR